MLTSRNLILAVMAALILGCGRSTVSVAAEPFVIDGEGIAFDTLYQTTVYGFRSFPISNIVSTDSKSGLGINAKVLTESINAVNPGVSVRLQDLALDRSGTAMTSKYAPVFIRADPGEQMTMAVQKLSAPSSGEYDAGFIVSTFATELVDRNFIQNHPGSVNEGDIIEFNPEVAMDLLSVYSGLNSLQNYEAAKIPVTFDQFNNALEQHSDLYAVAKLPIGNVEMGEPIPLEPNVLGIQVPQEWADAYTVKLVLFAITVRDYLKGVDQVDITIKFPRNCIAFDLVPVIYGQGLTDSDSPQQDRSLLIRTIFGGDVEYERRLKPVIQAYGLQSNEFGWRLSGEALKFGTTRLAALVRAPKKSKQVSMESAFVLRGPSSWIVEGSIGSSEPEIDLISF